ncbi:metallophosphoesterase [Neoroseomonas oryzicola]|uniref:Metallophosphoesterase n=1 Tax=Neoroseomonas oryzicola TaxID=535904 RepID=A0A9X9WGU8_9PROT|nr:metallophosphoesterase [Neoroseomonas oryzicola]MBR0659558.1 metallophosphoesterase [Neoroseomonas oryzicola]NKE16163.1 metallophosphoesterase [Neoroseomonas oryzicola]
MMSRRGLLAGLGATMATGTGSAAYALGVEPYLRLAVERHAFLPSNWPAGLRLRVVVLADLHAGAPVMDEARIEHIVAAANTLRPDLILLLGDYGPSTRYVTREIPHEDVARRLGALRAPLGVHAVLGNHDWWEDRDAVRHRTSLPSIGRALEASGIQVLQNDVVRAGPVLLGGLDSSWAYAVRHGADDLPKLLGQVTGDAPLLLMAHEPDTFTTLPGRVGVTFSGHTHGGQVRVMGWSPVVPSLYGNRYAWGHVREEGRDLVVSGGLGVSTFPVRFGVPPEITLVELGA